MPLRPRDDRGPRRPFRPSVAALEARELLSSLPSAPTADEQYMLQLINRARANPPAEGQRLVALAQTDPTLQAATQGVDLSAFLREIDSYGPLPPLAFNARLNAAALDHDAAMLAANNQVHAPNGFLVNPSLGLVAGDGQAYYPVSSSTSWATGENVFAYSGNVPAGSTRSYVDYFEAGLFIDWGNPDFGHLKNLLAPGPAEAAAAGQLPFSEIGIGLMTGVTPTTPAPANPENPANRGLNVGPDLLTQEFAWKTGPASLTGAAYLDSDGNNFYTPGEGLGGITIQAVGQHGEGSFQTVTWDSGGYSLSLPAGTYTVTASGPNLPARSSVVTIGQDNVEWDIQAEPTVSKADQPVPGNYDGLGHAEIAVYRSSTAQWFISGPNGGRSVTFGEPGVDIPAPGDYDGDGKTDIAVYRPTTGQFLILGSKVGPEVLAVGTPGQGVPVSADYDGDGKADPAVYDPSTARWTILGSSSGLRSFSFGQPGVDQPIPADYDGDGKADIAVYRPSTAQWLILGSSTGARVTSFGQPGVDQPIPADYDGDGKADLAVYRPTTAQWLILGSSTGPKVASFGQPGVDQPIPADYDGDGKADPSVFRPTTAQWLQSLSRGGASVTTFGQSGPAPTASAPASPTTTTTTVRSQSIGSAQAMTSPASTTPSMTLPTRRKATKTHKATRRV